MPERSDVDKDAWAQLLRELMDVGGWTAETAAAPRGPVPASSTSLYRWRSASPLQSVSAGNVVDTCRALGYPPLHALVKVGFLTAEEAGMAPAAPQPGATPLLRRISHDMNSPHIPEAARSELRAMIHDAHQRWQRMLKAFAQRSGGSGGENSGG